MQGTFLNRIIRRQTYNKYNFLDCRIIIIYFHVATFSQFKK